MKLKDINCWRKFIEMITYSSITDDAYFVGEIQYILCKILVSDSVLKMDFFP